MSKTPEEEKKWILELEQRKNKVIDALVQEEKSRTSSIVNFKPTLILNYRFLKLRKIGQQSERLRLRKKKAAEFIQRIKTAEKEEYAREKEEQKGQDVEVHNKLKEAEKKVTQLHLLEYERLRKRCLVKLTTIRPKLSL